MAHFEEGSVTAAVAKVKVFNELDEDIRTYVVTMICDVKPDTVDALVETVGPFLEHLSAADSNAACTALFTAMGVPAKAPAAKKAPGAAGRAGATGAAGASATGKGAVAATGGASTSAAGAGGSGEDDEFPRKLASSMTLGSMKREGDDDLMAFLWRKDTSERSSQFNQASLLSSAAPDDPRAAKKAAKAAKRAEAEEKRRLAAFEEMSGHASGAPVMTGGSSSGVRTQACVHWPHDMCSMYFMLLLWRVLASRRMCTFPTSRSPTGPTCSWRTACCAW